MTRDAAEPYYRETLGVPVGWWVGAAAVPVVVWWSLVLAAPGWFAAGAALAVAVAVAIALVHYGRAAVEVTNLHLRAGSARVPLAYCGRVEALDAAQTRALHGPQADARAFFFLRPYLSTAVRVEITDPHDPTPYWLVGTRHAADLADAITARLARG
ncbi:Protein of unknown function (DUF3093) [Mumia flava]|uniref:DUF3093 family protein n=1 Tax=Mumia flava TaxID=1348852 RepID=A0A0B2BQA5_9ACTN|nr:DUF3093 domain-containing protein [Mumia flava]PJJ53656.1 Protein of unknown function (DUF3093) [Mumia flava]